jgi:hypothetical protein
MQGRRGEGRKPLPERTAPDVPPSRPSAACRRRGQVPSPATGALAVSRRRSLAQPGEVTRFCVLAREAFFQRIAVEACFRAVGEEERPGMDRIFIGPGLTKQGIVGRIRFFTG